MLLLLLLLLLLEWLCLGWEAEWLLCTAAAVEAVCRRHDALRTRLWPNPLSPGLKPRALGA